MCLIIEKECEKPLGLTMLDEFDALCCSFCNEVRCLPGGSKNPVSELNADRLHDICEGSYCKDNHDMMVQILLAQISVGEELRCRCRSARKSLSDILDFLKHRTDVPTADSLLSSSTDGVAPLRLCASDS